MQASIFLLMSFLVFTFLFVRIIWKGIIHCSISPEVNYKKVSATAASSFTWLGYIFSHANNSNHHQKATESFSTLTPELLNLSSLLTSTTSSLFLTISHENIKCLIFTAFSPSCSPQLLWQSRRQHRLGIHSDQLILSQKEQVTSTKAAALSSVRSWICTSDTSANFPEANQYFKNTF